MKKILYTVNALLLGLLFVNPTFASNNMVIYEVGQFLTHQDDHINAPDDPTMDRATIGANKALKTLKRLLAKDAEAVSLIDQIKGINGRIFKESAENNDTVAAEIAETDMADSFNKLKVHLNFPPYDRAKALDAVKNLLSYQDDHIRAPDNRTMNRALRNIRTTKGILFINVLGTPASSALRDFTNTNWEVMELSAKNDDVKAAEVANSSGIKAAKKLNSLLESM